MYSALSRQSRVGPLSGTARYSLVTALALFLCAPPASALVHMGEAELILADGTVPRVVRTTSWEAPELAQKAWRTFQAQPELSKWQALWDSDTAVPLRLYGPGIEVRGSVNSAAIAERAAHDFLTQHRALLAPGSAVGDFRVVANDLDTGMRTVGFIQSRGGLDVVGGRYNVRFKNDRLFVVGSEALPHVPMPARTVAVMSDAELGERARVWVAKETGGQATLDKVMGPTIIPLLQEGSLPRYATVVEVIVNTKTPVGRYQVMLDIETGAPVSRRQMLKFYEATLSIDATRRWPGGERYNAPVPVTRVSVDGEARTTSEAGKIDLGEAETMSIVASVQSDRVAMYNSAGEEITETLELRANETTVWSHSDEEYEDAQLSAFVAANVARDRGRIIAPDMAWLTEEALQVTVNMEEQTCNAYSDGTTINFFRGSRDCHNTARLTDVVTHEFGHSFHAHSIIWGVGDFDTALSEGAADYMAATISDDPDMGRGFFRTNGPLRRLNDRDMRWPEDIGNDPHYTGLIFGGAMWDLREELRKTMGDEEGVAYSDWLMYQALKRSPDIPSSFI
ncbi:MAG: hypothetical protein VX834_09920, partial [Myxococcota bacterium]|nr:hypothetical protein [Myxococcota bacterium]